jgi:hypothetical protein
LRGSPASRQKHLLSQNHYGAFFWARFVRPKKPGFPLQVLGIAHAIPVGFPLQSLAQDSSEPGREIATGNFAGA